MPCRQPIGQTSGQAASPTAYTHTGKVAAFIDDHRAQDKGGRGRGPDGAKGEGGVVVVGQQSQEIPGCPLVMLLEEASPAAPKAQ